MTITENLYCSYYTKSEYITDYMVKRLQVQSDSIILEPSAGDGVFIDPLLEIDSNLNITAIDLNPETVTLLKGKYSNNPNIKILEADTLLDNSLDQKVIVNGYYDKIIGNPPYGAWQDYKKREELKKRYKGYYVKETYTLFLLRCVSLLRRHGTLTFIIPDTFLNLHMHKQLREYILLNTKISEILMIPSNFFPGVNFGYANLTIITVKKCSKEDALNNTIRIISGLKKVSDIENITEEKNLEKYNIINIKQKEVFDSIDMAFLIKSGDDIRRLINNSETTLGDLADCVTGFYSGDNSRFFKVANSQVRNISKCEVIKTEEINYNFIDYPDILDGIDEQRCFIPVIKGNSKGYLRKDEWFLNWSKEAVQHYKTDKKARFQNSQYYFRKGIALPMVKASKVSASLIDNKVFDQSIVGVFPKDTKHLYLLLALINSDIANTIIQTINHTANNSANYIKKIPIVIPSDTLLAKINKLVENQISQIKKTGSHDKNIDLELNKIFKELYQG
ncbi:Eco57I restriction-modification methylase domain-containing protein [Paenibacillus sp. WLX2291]|uniref:Eco57I restriction-modification methylase domain-containing protein n=1 Tax=Paenibacillus sp. WLX2291 TaxID=3296934 RepID=UPI0039842ADE